MLAVLVILASLASILLPVFTSAKRIAKGQVCSSNLKQQFVAVLLYQSDNDELYPYGVNGIEHETKISLGLPPGSNASDYPAIGESLGGYLRDRRVRVCPLDGGRSFISDLVVSKLSEHNGGSSYLCADLVEGQTSSSWIDPSKGVYCIDGSPAWHAGMSVQRFNNLPDERQGQLGRQYTLYYDGHIKSTGQLAPCWSVSGCGG